MNKKFFKKTGFIFFFLLAYPLVFAFTYYQVPSNDDSILDLNYDNNKNKFTLNFNYYNFYNDLTDKLASGFNFKEIKKYVDSGTTPVFVAGTEPIFYAEEQKNGTPLKEMFFNYVSGLSDLLNKTYNNQRSGSAEFIIYVYPGYVDEDSLWQKGEILAKIPLHLPSGFLNNISSNESYGDLINKDDWPTFKKTFTLSKNPGEFSFFVFYNQTDHESLPKCSKDEDSFISESGFKELDPAHQNLYIMDLDRGEPNLDFTISENHLPNFNRKDPGGNQKAAYFNFDNPYGDNSTVFIPIIVGAISLLLAISLYFPVLKYARNKF